jgi:hypothetical protein
MRILLFCCLLTSCAVYQEDLVPSNLASPKDGMLRCVDLGPEEFDIPRSEVYIWMGGKDDAFVGRSQACSEINRESYATYDIPENAIDACGGWYAGSGDYYYSIEEEGTIKVYYGWLDEAEPDSGMHWEVVYE